MNDCKDCDFVNFKPCKACKILKKTVICSKCGTKRIVQSAKLKLKYDINKTKCRKCNSNQIPQTLTYEQKQFLNGLMLGDGSIVYPTKNGSLFPRLTITRKSTDIEYLNWQYNFFKEFYNNTPKLRSAYDKRTEKIYYSCNIQTKSGQIFKDYHNKWYLNGKKIVPRDLVLTPLTLLIWFLDDGCITTSSKNALTMKLSTDGFLKDDVSFLAQLLSDFIGKKINIYKNGNGLILKASTLATIEVIKIIDPIFPDFMNRKKIWTNFDFEFIKNSKRFKTKNNN